MSTLLDMPSGSKGVVAGIEGDVRFTGRITSIGITPGCKVTVVKNEKSLPILVYSRDTMIALNRNECKNIQVEGVVA
ncbi:MAG: ferrous iron transport protein A [Lachnospiraceae bacterium]|nr:ferrous iron transport protein A [Lachnospiraceae bacterium]